MFILTLGWVLTAGASIFWLCSMGGVWAKSGFMTMLSLMNPFNIWQYAMTFLLFLPGGLAIYYGSK